MKIRLTPVTTNVVEAECECGGTMHFACEAPRAEFEPPRGYIHTCIACGKSEVLPEHYPTMRYDRVEPRPRLTLLGEVGVRPCRVVHDVIASDRIMSAEFVDLSPPDAPPPRDVIVKIDGDPDEPTFRPGSSREFPWVPDRDPDGPMFRPGWARED